MTMRPMLWIAVALAAAIVVTVSVLTEREKANEKVAAEESAEDDDEGCCGEDGEKSVIRPAVELLGRSDAPVKVVGFVPDSSTHDGVIRMLRELAGNHVDEVHLTLHADNTHVARQEMEKLGHTGPGFFVNGRKQFTLRDEDGTAREVVFEGDPCRDYKLNDLRTVIEQAMAGGLESDAGSEPQADEAAGKAASAQARAEETTD